MSSHIWALCVGLAACLNMPFHSNVPPVPFARAKDYTVYDYIYISLSLSPSLSLSLSLEIYV